MEPSEEGRAESVGAADGAARASAGEDTARAAGRGGLAIAGAKVSFILFGFAQQLILPRLLGVSGYGEFSIVLSLVSIVNNVVVATAIQGVSRAVSSAAPVHADEAFRRTLRVHAVLAVVLSVAFIACAGLLADWEGAPHVARPLRLVGSVVFLYGVYAPLVGSLNGRRRFGTQAALDTGYGAMRMISITLGAYLFLRAGASGVLGAVVGFIAAAAAIVPVALSRTGIGRASAEPAPLGESPYRAAPGAPAAGPSAGEYLSFLLPLGIGQIFLNLLMQTDFLLLRRFAGQAATSPEAADALQGVYRGVQLFSFLPYQLLMSITFILFPMLARAQAEGDRAAVRSYARTGVRLALVLTGLMCSAVSSTAPHLLRVVFPEEIWTQGGPALRILSLGMGSFSLLGILSAALTSLGRARAAAGLTLGAVACVAIGCSLTVPGTAFGPAMLVQSAIATSVALTAAAVAGGVLMAWTAGGVVAPLSLARVLGAIGLAVAVGSRLPWIGRAGALVEVAAVGAIYLAVLVVTREIGAEDLARVKQVVRRKK